MPRCRDPHKADFRVYTFSVNGHVFYVGMGREARATDRIRWTKYCMRRELSGATAKWSVNTLVIARLLKRGIDPRLRFVTSMMSRAQALAHEKKLIGKLRANGVLLANRTHNGGRSAATVERIVRALYDSVTARSSGPTVR
jgi:hypothetical protein